jgi:hypothetical protein
LFGFLLFLLLFQTEKKSVNLSPTYLKEEGGRTRDEHAHSTKKNPSCEEETQVHIVEIETKEAKKVTLGHNRWNKEQKIGDVRSVNVNIQHRYLLLGLI